jgi:hypothetical protein
MGEELPEHASVLNRMRDVCFALHAAERHGQRLNRIQIQKLVYLHDVVCHIFSILPPQEGHTTYKNGPYHAAIQNAADALAFRGFLRIHEIRRTSLGIRAIYGLTEAGRSLAERMGSRGTFETSWQTYLLVADKVNELGWARIVKLVYAEPTYLRSRPRGYGQSLDPGDGLSSSASALTALIEYALGHGFGEAKIDPIRIVGVFFQFLDEYDKRNLQR